MTGASRAAISPVVIVGLTVALGVTALLLALAPGPLYRAGVLELRPAFMGMRWGAYLGGAAAGLGFIALIAALEGARPRLALVSALVLFLGGLCFMVPYQWRAQARSVPPIHDITTDTENPPAFVDVAPLRADAPNPVAYAGAEVAAKQIAAYPDLAPLVLEGATMEAAFRRAESAARAMGWTMVAAVPAEGRIEATATTLWFGFKDDVVIRLREAAGGVQIDVRSKSRVGGSDVGANAARIRAYLEAVKR